MPCYRDQQQLDKDIVPKLLPSIAGHCCFQDKETSLIQRGPTRLASASPSGSNGDDRRQRRKQGGAVGAAASRMQATAQQTLGAATRSPYLRRKLPPRLPALLSRHFPRSALYLLYICILPVFAQRAVFSLISESEVSLHAVFPPHRIRRRRAGAQQAPVREK